LPLSLPSPSGSGAGVRWQRGAVLQHSLGEDFPALPRQPFTPLLRPETCWDNVYFAAEMPFAALSGLVSSSEAADASGFGRAPVSSFAPDFVFLL